MIEAPGGIWHLTTTNYTRQHQMSIGGQVDEFTHDGLVEVGHKLGIRNPQSILEATVEVFSQWPQLAKQWGVTDDDAKRVRAGHRLYLAG